MQTLATHIQNFAQVKALVVGDIMLDCFEYGEVKRISPEAPVPVFRLRHEKKMLGGAGNVVANLVALGCQTTFMGVVGDDREGRLIATLLRSCGARAYLLKLKHYATIVKTRLIAGNQHILRADTEELLNPAPELLPRFTKILEQVIQQVDIILLSDYNKGVLTTATTQLIIGICQRFHKQIIIDPKGNDYAKYRGASLVKPNLKEFREATGIDVQPTAANFHAEIKRGAMQLFADYQIQNLVVTLSEYGMLHISATSPDIIQQVKTKAQEVFDVSGAGDTALAVLGAALGVQAPLRAAMELANVASGIVVGKLGTATVAAKELLRALALDEKFDDDWPQMRKIVDLDQAEILISELKAQGKIVGFTNGCFDCCHLGHLHSLIKARQQCDVLIVAVNSDASIKRYKGEARPLQNERTRMLLLASLTFVDYVILFSEDTPLEIIKRLQPDILAKEGYRLEDWPEAQYAAATYGAKIVTLTRLEGYSTSDFLEKIMQQQKSLHS